MRPRLIASVPGLSDSSLTPFERFEKFARIIVSVPKEEADKETKKSELTKRKSKAQQINHGTQNGKN